VDVMDDGPGVPPDILHRVFDPFFTTKDAVHGVGLGLFVAEGLVRTAGGSIVARHARDRSDATYRGAWFHIELPAPNETAAARGAGELPASARPSSAARG
jgi:C4-dicarboxylate-specific signal transduction histidine kinase